MTPKEIARRALAQAIAPVDLTPRIEAERARPDALSLHAEISQARALIAEYQARLTGPLSEADTAALMRWQDIVGRMAERQRRIDADTAALTHLDLDTLRGRAMLLLTEYAPDATTAAAMYRDLFRGFHHDT